MGKIQNRAKELSGLYKELRKFYKEFQHSDDIVLEKQPTKIETVISICLTPLFLLLFLMNFGIPVIALSAEVIIKGHWDR